MTDYSYSDPLDELYAVYISTRIYLDRYDDLLDPIFQKKNGKIQRRNTELLHKHNDNTTIRNPTTRKTI